MDVAEALAAGAHEGVVHLHVDLFQRLDAVGHEPRAHHIHRLDALPGQCLHRGLGVGLDPFRAAKARLEGQQPVFLGQPQGGGNEGSAFLALLHVGVALIHTALRQAVEAEDELLGLAGLGLAPEVADALGYGSDVAGVIVKALQEAQRRNAAPLEELAGNHVKHGTAGGGRVLRVHRQHDDARETPVTQVAQGVDHRRVAIAHGPDHLHLPAPLVQLVLQRLGHQLRVDQQRRAGLGPDGAVLLGRLLGSASQHHGVQDGPPDQGRLLDNPPVGEELTQVAAHLRHLRLVGRAQLDQQDGGAGGWDGIVHGRRRSCGQRGPSSVISADCRGWLTMPFQALHGARQRAASEGRNVPLTPALHPAPTTPVVP